MHEEKQQKSFSILQYSGRNETYRYQKVKLQNGRWKRIPDNTSCSGAKGSVNDKAKAKEQALIPTSDALS